MNQDGKRTLTERVQGRVADFNDALFQRTWVWTIRWERKWRDVWVGAYWRSLSSIGYEIDPRFLVRQTKGGTYYQRTNFDLWVCIVPCFPIHLRAWRPREPRP